MLDSVAVAAVLVDSTEDLLLVLVAATVVAVLVLVDSTEDSLAELLVLVADATSPN